MTQIEIAHRNSAIVKSAKEGHTIVEIAEIFSMNPRRIMSILKSARVKAKRPIHALESDVCQAIIKELNSGFGRIERHTPCSCPSDSAQQWCPPWHYGQHPS